MASASPPSTVSNSPAPSDRDLRSFAFLIVAFLSLVLGAMLTLQDVVERREGDLLILAEPDPLDEAPDLPLIVPTIVATPEPTPEPQPEAPPPPSEAPIAWARISTIGVDSPVIVLGIDGNGVMETPSKPLEIAWYDFTGRPGFGSNAVFAGHVDMANFGPAVFWRLRQLREGDEIQVGLQDETVYTYRVVSNTTYNANSAPVEEIIGPTDHDVITLITCDGTFNTRTREYDSRLVVRAERV